MHFVAAKVFFFLVENVEIFDQILDDIKYDGSGWFDIVRESLPVGVVGEWGWCRDCCSWALRGPHW